MRRPNECTRLLAILWVLAGALPGNAAAQGWMGPLRSGLDPFKGHITLPVSESVDALRPVRIRLYATTALDGEPAIELDDRGITVRKQLVCVLRRRRQDIAYPGNFSLVTPEDQPCPADLPIKLVESGGLFLEVARIEGTRVEVQYRGARFFFDLRSLPGNPWQPTGVTPQVLFPEASPPLVGAVDIPAAFRPSSPRSGFAITLRTAPAADAPAVTVVRAARYFEVVGLGGGAMAAKVYQRTNHWSLIRLVDGRKGWLAPADAGKYASLERLLHRDQMFISENWDRRLARAPGGAERFVVAPNPRRLWIGYLERRGLAQTGIPVFERPDRAGVQVAFAGEEGPMLATVDVEGPGASAVIVFSRRPGWFEVGLAQTDEMGDQPTMTHGWIEDQPSNGVLHTVEPDEARRLLDKEWPEQEAAVDVLGTVSLNGVLWIHVRVVAGTECSRGFYPESVPPLGEGWIPAHDHVGHTTLWFNTYCD